MQTVNDGEPTPVGVTIAYKRKNATSKQLNATPPKQLQKPVRPAHNSWQVFVEGATLYLACLVLPTVAGLVMRFFQGEWIVPDPATPETWSSWSSQLVYQTASHYLCENREEEGSILSSYVGSNWYWCPSEQVDWNAGESSPLSPDTESTDFGYVAMMSLTLAVLRTLVVRYLVPLENVEGVQAWVRCKSLHLLSSDYSESLTPRTDKAVVNVDTTDAMAVPSLDVRDDVGLSLDESTHATSDLNSERWSSYQDEPQEPVQLFRDLSMRLEQQQQQQEEEAAPKQRLHAAPRYATAVFRLAYSTMAILMAWTYFKDADFWPWYVGGHGATKNCWDLSGGFAHVLDSDFDQRNRVLKNYFLWQASYHWHSGAFHVISMLMLLLKPRHNEAPRRFLSFTTGSTAYFRSLLQHVLSLAMITTAYIFSSLRRLLTIGMFAFDISSWCLHLLQVCVNAPDDSPLCRPEFIRKLHPLVLVVFGLARFGIWPLLWYSSAFESEKWLQQLEQTIVPGAAWGMRGVTTILFLLLMAVTAVYAKRLWNHPQLGRIA